MSDFIEELFLRLACETPLPDNSTGRQADKSSARKPYTRAQARFEQQACLLLNPLRLPTSNKKRGRKPEFDIFVDVATANNTPLSPSPKKLKSDARAPLSVRTDSANDTPLPSPRQPDRPFPFSHSDPLWANVENYDPRPYYMTPPPTPGGSSPTPSPSPFSSPRSSTRAVQHRRLPYANPLPPPKDGTLYRVLELNNWRANEVQIKNAYRKVAVEYHPDKVAEEQREAATRIMQNVNAAKEVLLDNKRRRAYHLDGRLPWPA